MSQKQIDLWQGPGGAADEHTVVVDTVNDFIPHSSIAPSVFGLQYEVINHGSQYAYRNIDENDSMAQSEPRSVSSTILQRVNREETNNIVRRISAYHVRADDAVKVTTMPGESST